MWTAVTGWGWWGAFSYPQHVGGLIFKGNKMKRCTVWVHMRPNEH